MANLKKKEKDFKKKKENIKEQYKKSSEEEIKKIRKGLLKKIGDKLNLEKKKFGELYSKQEKIYNSKLNEFSSKIINESKTVTNSLNQNNENKKIINIDNNMPKPDTNLNDKNTDKNPPIIQENNLANNLGNDNNININNNNHINENVIHNEVKNSLNKSNYTNNKTFTNKEPEINTGDIIKNYNDNNNNQINNINNQYNYLDEVIEEETKIEEYSYDCTNSMYLTVYIYEGTEQAEVEIFLRNNGTKTWANDSKLINDPSSALRTDVILLAQQKPNEERGYKTIIKDLGKYPNGEYKTIYLFYTNGKIRGEKITAMVKIKEKENKN
jgi:hypothetical protein